MAFNVNGEWQLHQTTGHTVTLNLIQTGEDLQGTASTTGLTGTGQGRVVGNGFLFIIDWNPGNAKGEYNGVFGVDGRLTGHTFDQNHPASQAGWFSLKKFRDG